MASTSETGHAKNVSNFESLISYANGYGTAYNPSRATIKLPALNTLYTNSKTALAAVNTAFTPYSNAVAAREVAFEPLSKLLTRVQSASVATDTTTQVDDNIKTIIRKMQGRRASAKLTDQEKAALKAEGKETKQISTSQQGFDDKVENLDKLIKLLSGIPLYTPNEADLKVTSLTTLYNDLKAKNSAVVAAATILSNARIARNDVLYKPLTGLVDTALDTKEYIKSVYGASSPQYKQVSGIVFKTIKRD